ncbi:MAG: TonB-dependent receptor [Acidobacteriota bacterium]
MQRPRSFSDVRWLALAVSLLVLPALAAPGTLLAQDTGSLVGSVGDADGSPLPGAAVRIEGTQLTTRTGVDGRFRLVGVPAGEQEVVVDFLGFERATDRVDVTAGAVAALDVTLQPSFTDAVTVSASPILEGQAKALNQQKTAINIQNIVSSDQLGRFPDPNAAEATQRIPGITLQRDQGEGRYVIVRGTEARLNSMTINGERIPSPEGDVRQVALDVIPADLLEAIEVSKALTPDMDGDAIGGAVNLVTKRAPAQRRISVTGAFGENDLDGGDILSGNVLWGERFSEGRTGLVLALSTMETDRGSENFEPEYDDSELAEFQLRDYLLTRERDGFNIDLDHRASESSELRFHGIWNEFGDDEFRRRRISIVEDGEIERTLRDRFEVQTIQAAALEGNHLVSGSLVDWRVSWADSEEDEPRNIETVFKQEDVIFAPNVSPGSIDPDNIQPNPLNEDLGAFEFDEIEAEDNFTSEQDFVVALNVARPFQRDGGSGGLLKFGGKYRAKDKERNNEVFEVDTDDLLLADFLDGFSDRDFLDGRYALGRFPDPLRLRNIAETSPLERDPEEDLADYDTSEDTLAVYGLADLQIGDKLSFLGGVRWESTDADYRANEVIFDVDGEFAGINPVRGSDSYDVFLPSAHLRYALDEDSNVRVALTRSLARPDFESLAPFELVVEEDGEIERGNPQLDVTTAWNFDLMYERYFRSVGIFSAGIFAKQISDPIYFFTFEEPRGGETFDVVQPRNGEDADLFGFELAYQNQIRSGPLQGLGFYANLTWTDSEATFPERADSRFPGQAETVYNVALSYERRGFSGRISFNFHGEYLQEVGSGPESDIWIDEHFQIDFSASQRITDQLRLFVELINLDDEPFRVYEGTPDRPRQEEYYSWWGTIGLKWDF